MIEIERQIASAEQLVSDLAERIATGLDAGTVERAKRDALRRAEALPASQSPV